MNCPNCNRRLADSAKVCPTCQHDFVTDRKQKAIARLVLAVVLLAMMGFAVVLALLPGIIINSLRGRYKDNPRHILRASVRDWQTWIISLPISTVAFIVLNSCGAFDEIIRSFSGDSSAEVKVVAVESDANVRLSRAVPVPDEPQPPNTFQSAVVKAIPIEISYSVVGVAEDDALNVRSGPGANYNIVAKLPNGYNKLGVVGSPIMNGTTEWVQITFENRTGWVTKQYIQSN